MFKPVTHAQLVAIMPLAGIRIYRYAICLNAAMAEYHIDTPARQAMFLAQLAHESGELRYVRELASGEAYEGRKDLGNTEDGDGIRYKGRGLIQITGKSNYAICSLALGVDVVNHPELLETPELACRSAAWFWWNNGLNELADKDDFLGVTKRINGGTNGFSDRMKYHARAQQVLTTDINPVTSASTTVAAKDETK